MPVSITWRTKRSLPEMPVFKQIALLPTAMMYK
jgi:hypothetical protein